MDSKHLSPATWPHVWPSLSAGGTGVLLNVDRVAELLEELGYPSIQVRGLADSGWFLDNKQYRRSDCIDTINCAPTEAIRRGIRCQGCGWRAAPMPKPSLVPGVRWHLKGRSTLTSQPNLRWWLQVLERDSPRALSAPVQGRRRMELLLRLQSISDSAL